MAKNQFRKPPYTPGPWAHDENATVYDPTTGWHIAKTNTNIGRLLKEISANTILISKAPEMYEAIKAFLRGGKQTFDLAHIIQQIDEELHALRNTEDSTERSLPG